MTTATFKKLRSGEWGIRVAGASPPAEGELVTVTLSGGGTKEVTVAKVVAQFPDACLCAIVGNGSNVPAVAKAAFTLTAEQEQARALFLTGASLAIEAGAGTGKTSTLVELGRAVPAKRVQYVAFNKAIVADSAAKFGENVDANTAHSLAFRAIGYRFAARLDNSRRIKSTELAKMLRVEPVTVTTWTNERKTLSATFLAGLCMKSIERFCQTADLQPTYRHVPLVPNLDAPSSPERPTSYAVNNAVGRALEPALKRAWTDLCRYDGALPYKPSHYLKLWQLTSPRIAADIILFDEAQDASPVMVDVVRQQTHAQVVWVGDSQQEIYAWAGAVNALADVPADQRTFLTQSFRFGPAVADVANRCLTALRAELRLTGTDGIPSVVEATTVPDAVLCRTNATAVRKVLSYLDQGKRPHLVGGGGEIAAFARAARDLMSGVRVDHPELACFESWGEVQEYVEQDEQGSDLQLMVKLIDEFGVETLLDALDPKRMVREQDADVVVSTAHKAKGREWGVVKLASDFKDEPKDEELRLLYVAVTRARLVLDVTDVKYLATDAGAQA